MKALHNVWWHTILCAIFILVLSLYPGHHFPKLHWGWEDLVVHVTMYASLAYCLYLSFYDRILGASHLEIVLAVITLILFGFSVEILQKLLPIHRSFAWADVAANAIGASLFFEMVRLRHKKN